MQHPRTLITLAMVNDHLNPLFIMSGNVEDTFQGVILECGINIKYDIYDDLNEEDTL